MPERHVLEPDDGCRANDAGQAANALGHDGVALVRHRRRSFLTTPERLLDFTDLRAGEVANLRRKALERRRAERERREQLRVTVPRYDLRCDRLGGESQSLASDALDVGIAAPVRPHRAGELADAHGLQGAQQAFTVSIQLECPPGQLGAERDRLRVNPMRPAGHRRVAGLLGAPHDRLNAAIDAFEQEGPGLAYLPRGCGSRRRLPAAQLPLRPSLRARTARPRASGRAGSRPTRCASWPGGSSARSL